MESGQREAPKPITARYDLTGWEGDATISRDEDLEESIHSLLIDKYNVPLVRACHTIEARVLSGEGAELLQVEPGTAGFVVDRVTHTIDDRPVTRSGTVYRGDEYRFTAEFQCSLLPQVPWG